MIYKEIFEEFCKKFPNADYEDYRPADPVFIPQLRRSIPNGIVVWLKDGSKITYIAKGELLNGGWIPVSKGLPEEYESVIVSVEDGVYPDARYSKEYGWEWAYEAGSDYWRELEGVVAWMPLPEPYIKKEEEK